MAKQADVIYRDDLVFAMVNSKFSTTNPGHVVVVPVAHYENIYDLPKEVGHRIADVAQRVAIALKEARRCDGVMTMQLNEPAAGQHAFHYHLHLIPRFKDDNYKFGTDSYRVTLPEERLPYAEALRAVLT